MTQNDKLYFNFGILILAYAYSIYGEHWLAIFLGLIASILSIQSHSLGCLKNNYRRIVVTTLFALIFLYMSHLHVYFPSLRFLALCNAIFVWLNQESSFKVLDPVMPKLLMIVASLFVIILILPIEIMDFFVSGTNGTLQQILLILIMFVPSFVAYFYKCKKEMHLNQLNLWH